jgi:hypothetical protein
VWAPIFKAYEPIREWLAAKETGRPVHDFSMTMVTSFRLVTITRILRLGVGESYRVAG